MKRSLPNILILCALALSAGMASAQNFEVWNCPDFNVQGNDNGDYRQYYPFHAKIGDLYVLADFGTGLVLLNPDFRGNRFAYVVYRVSGAPVWWLSFGPNWTVDNSSEIISSCDFFIASGCEAQCFDQYTYDCQPGTSCFCATTTEGYGVCVDNRLCPPQSECDTSADCVRGQRCLTCTGCGAINVCDTPECGSGVLLKEAGPTTSGR